MSEYSTFKVLDNFKNSFVYENDSLFINSSANASWIYLNCHDETTIRFYDMEDIGYDRFLDVPAAKVIYYLKHNELAKTIQYKDDNIFNLSYDNIIVRDVAEYSTEGKEIKCFSDPKNEQLFEIALHNLKTLRKI